MNGNSAPSKISPPVDMKDVYLNTPMQEYEYIHLPLHLIPPEIIQQCNLLDLVDSSCVYMEIWKGVYGLPQASCITYDHICLHL